MLQRRFNRHCLIYKAQSGRWYLELADLVGQGADKAVTYGPFLNRLTLQSELSRHPHPGRIFLDDSGSRPDPTVGHRQPIFADQGHRFAQVLEEKKQAARNRPC